MHWRLDCDPALLGSVGLTDATRWAIQKGIFWQVPTIATVTGVGRVMLENPVYDGTELSLRYLGPPPVINTAAGGTLVPIPDRPIPF